MFREPTLEEILADEATLVLMARDHVRPDEVRALMRALKQHIARVSQAA